VPLLLASQVPLIHQVRERNIVSKKIIFCYDASLGWKQMERQLTLRSLIIGLAGLLVITASSMYVALRMGALPWPTVFVTVVSMAVLKHCKGSTLHEINVTHTIMSSGAMVAGGLAFTLPGLWILNPSAQVPVISLIAMTIVGTMLGTLFTSLFRKKMIEEEQLPYPMGQAAYNTLQAGMKGGKNAKTLFASLGGSVVFTLLRDVWHKIPAILPIFGGSTLFPPLSMWVSPMAAGIGAIIGPALALVWALGMIVGYFLLTPIGLATGLFPDMAAADLFRSNLGIGLMIGTGLGVFIQAIINLAKKKKNTGKREKLSKASKLSLVAVLIFSMIILTLLTEVTIGESVILIIGVFATTYLSSMLTGQTGVNPMEIFGILVLLVVQFLFKPTLVPCFTIAAVTAVACGLAGDVMNDLKSGYLLKANPRAQIVGEGIGGVVGSVVAVFVLLALKQSFGGFGTAQLPAPQATAVSAMIGGLGHMPAFSLGCAIGLVLFLCKVPTATLGLGVYLPPNISSIMGVGAILVALIKHAAKGKYSEEEINDKSNLISSGLLGGEGITGVCIAIISML